MLRVVNSFCVNGFMYYRRITRSGDGHSFLGRAATPFTRYPTALYFNNDNEGHAIRDAKRLRDLLQLAGQVSGQAA
jgi:hypothetical protein